jgi:hypothetical protein
VFGVKGKGGAFVGGGAAVAVVSIPGSGRLVVGVEGAGRPLEAGRVAGTTAGAAILAQDIGVIVVHFCRNR